MSVRRLISLVDKRSALRAKDFYKAGIHPQELRRACERGLLSKIDRGLYARNHFQTGLEHQIAIACTRVPHGVVCLKSAAQYHGLTRINATSIWMAIHSKAKMPQTSGVKLRFVRFSGPGFTQGVVNTKIDGVPIRVHSAAKTVADCLKFRKKISPTLAMRILQESIAGRKCSEQRLRHFAKICRVGKLVKAAYSLLPNHYAGLSAPITGTGRS